MSGYEDDTPGGDFHGFQYSSHYFHQTQVQGTETAFDSMQESISSNSPESYYRGRYIQDNELREAIEDNTYDNHYINQSTASAVSHQHDVRGSSIEKARQLTNKHTSPYFSETNSTNQFKTAASDYHAPPLGHPHDQDSATIFRNSPYFSQAPTLSTDTSASASSELETSTPRHRRPVPARSAFMCFSEARRREITASLGRNSKDGFVEKVADEWRALSNKERSYWEEIAKREKSRYANEKEAYKGPHYARKLRAKKNPLAPKRPMSAFLMYAQRKRSCLQRENPDMSNADISRLLGEMWRKASKPEKTPFLEREEVERKIYRAKMESWKSNQKLAKSLSPPNGKRDNKPKKTEQREAEQRQDTSSFATEDYSANDQRYGYSHYTANYPDTSNYSENYIDAPIYENCNNHSEPGYLKYSYPRPDDEHRY